jgi:hypothetical protein
VRIAREYGQAPHTVAEWPSEWLAAAETAMSAENAAAAELQRRHERTAKLRRAMGG